MEKTTLNKLTELCNLLDSEKIIICYGDFLLNTITDNIIKYKISKNKIKFIHLDIKIKLQNQLTNIFSTSSLIDNTIIYIVDNAEFLKKTDYDFLKRFKTKLLETTKSIILCSMNKINYFGFKQLQIGEVYSNKISLQYLIIDLFTNINREYVLNTFLSQSISLSYLLKIITYNLNFFYNINDMNYNIDIINNLTRFLYKISTKIFLRYLIYSFKIGTIKKAIRYPPKDEKK